MKLDAVGQVPSARLMSGADRRGRRGDWTGERRYQEEQKKRGPMRA